MSTHRSISRTRPRKTVDTEVIRSIANRILAVTPDSFDRERGAVFRFAEELLTAAGAYRGFQNTEHTLPVSGRDNTRRRLL
jgi:hypothetical protein